MGAPLRGAGSEPLVPDPQARLRRLLEANRQAVEHLDLSTVLRQIVEAAVELVAAEFGALGVLDSHGNVEELIHVGVLLRDPVEGLEQTTLTVPLEVRGESYGQLQLVDSHRAVFSEEDRQLVEALAATAGVAIAHARLFEESTRREQWTAATGRITHELLTDDDVDALALIAQTMLELAGADLVAVILAGDGDPLGELRVDRAAGVGSEAVLGAVLTAGTMVERCLGTRRPLLVDALDHTTLAFQLASSSLGPAMAVPLLAEVGARGCLLVVRDRGSHSFSQFDLDVAASLAGHAALALDRADARQALARTAMLEDRDRIARDLHDHVIQRLFAAGLNIQSVAMSLPAGAPADTLSGQVDEIDATIRQIRMTIFGLHITESGSTGVRAQILEVIRTASVLLPAPPDVTFHGPLDLLVAGHVADDVIAVVREGIVNVARHAAARHVQLVVAADAHLVSVDVVDDGVGVVDGVALSGLANLRARAEEQGGSFELGSRAGGGTRLHWTAPLGPPT